MRLRYAFAPAALALTAALICAPVASAAAAHPGPVPPAQLGLHAVPHNNPNGQAEVQNWQNAGYSAGESVVLTMVTSGATYYTYNSSGEFVAPNGLCWTWNKNLSAVEFETCAGLASQHFGIRSPGDTYSQIIIYYYTGGNTCLFQRGVDEAQGEEGCASVQAQNVKFYT